MEVKNNRIIAKSVDLFGIYVKYACLGYISRRFYLARLNGHSQSFLQSSRAYEKNILAVKLRREKRFPALMRETQEAHAAKSVVVPAPFPADIF